MYPACPRRLELNLQGGAMERSRSLSPVVRKWVGQKAGPSVQSLVTEGLSILFAHPPELGSILGEVPRELPFRDQKARH